MVEEEFMPRWMLKENIKMKNKEIGSEFWDIPVSINDNVFFIEDYEWFISGRAALDFIIKDILTKKPVKKIAVPSWCCDTMLSPIINNNLEYEFYPVIIKDNKLYKNLNNINADILLNLDYFGYRNNDDINFDGIVINDVTHSLFTETKEYDYTFGSLRKWAGFKTGGFAYCKDKFVITNNGVVNDEYVYLRKEAMKQKEIYISGISNDKQYLDLFKKAENQLENAFDYKSSKEDINDAKHFNVGLIKEKRKENAECLLNELKEYAIFKDIKENDCPLFVPIIVPNGKRDELRKYLIENNVYCPIHWPLTSLHKLDNEELFIYNNELSIVCDQRYDKEDMSYVSKLIKDFKC